MGKKKAKEYGPRTSLPYTPRSFDLNDGSTFWVSTGLCVQTVALNDDGSVKDLPKVAAQNAELGATLWDWNLPQTFGKAKPSPNSNHHPLPPTFCHTKRWLEVDTTPVEPEWQELIDPETESVYFYNPATKESRWDNSGVESHAPSTHTHTNTPQPTHRAMTTGLFEHGLPSSPAPLPGQHIVFDHPSSEDGSLGNTTITFTDIALQPIGTRCSGSTTASVQGAPEASESSQSALPGVPVWPHDDPALASYWESRYQLFSRFDQGILIDREGWFSVTPELVAAHQAALLLETPGFVVDLGCCVGGNTVQLAAAGHRVLAVDVCASRLALAAHNASVYGVRDQADAVFVSPPWGGCGYKATRVYGVLEDMGGTGLSLPQILEIAQGMLADPVWGTVGVFLPRNTNLSEVATLVPPGCLWRVVRYIVGRKFKGVLLLACNIFD